ncbi:MAG: cytochrome c biogenesis protein CcsA [Planctomycetota bacterium]
MLLILLAGLGVSVQAATGPDGNTLPNDAAPALTPDQVDHLDPHAGHDHGEMTRRQHQEFADAVDLDVFRKLPVFDGGRVKIIDTLARERVTMVYGKPRWIDFTWETFDAENRKDQKKYKYDPVFTYLDMTLNRQYYANKPILYVEVLPFREKLLAHLPAEEQEAWKKLGRISWEMFADPEVQAVYRAQETSQLEMKGRNQLFGAADAFLNAGSRLLMISPAPGSESWTHIDPTLNLEPTGVAVVPASSAAAQVPGAVVRQAGMGDYWPVLADAWRHGDAETVNAMLELIAEDLPTIHPDSYPPAYRLNLERIYNATGKFTIGYWFYAFATLAMLLALGTGRKTLLVLGVTLLLVAFAAHAGSFAIRAILSGRWAIHNQYESFIAISLFAVLVGVIFMFAKRLWVFGAAAAALGTVSLLVANLWEIPSHEVGPVAGILDTSRILYVHVNMVLVSYGLIALSFFVSVAYLFAHYVKGKESAAFVAAGTGSLYSASTSAAGGVSGGGDGAAETPRVPGRKRLLADLDQAQLMLMQLAFWLLGVGILLGAYWADHAWGRWWAWDPKETWALITWIVYLIAIHARFGVRNRGLVTAWLSVAGFVVMLWTYWGVNLLLAGLHSYA